MRAGSENWVDLTDLLEAYPYVTFELNVSTPDGLGGGWLYFDGYEIDWKCFEDGEYVESADGRDYPTNECLEKQRALCGQNYIEEFLPGTSGCLSNVASHASWREVARPFEMLEALARKEPAASASLAEFPWVRDGINTDDLDILYELVLLASNIDLHGWEFLERVDTWDIHAMDALQRLAEHEGYSREIASYLEQQGGLSDEQVPMILALRHVLSREDLTPHRSNIIEIMLDPEQTTTIRRVIDLPFTGKFTLSVIVPSKTDIPSFAPSILTPESPVNVMQYLEDSVVLMEEFIGVHFPYNYAFVLVADFLAGTTRFGGYYGGSGLIYSSVDGKDTIAHETAHIYWSFPSVWITEGAAILFEAISENSPFREFRNYVCSVTDNITIDNIAAIEQLEHELGRDQIIASGCYRSFGSILFTELHQSLDEAAFRRGFRNLYLALRDETYESVCAGEHRTDGATPEQLAVIDEIVARRYYGRGLG